MSLSHSQLDTSHPAHRPCPRLESLLMLGAHGAMLVAATQAVVNGFAGRPEWCYLRATGVDPTTMLGADRAMFGYLPGVFGLLRALLACGETAALLVLAGLNLIAAIRIMRMQSAGLPGLLARPPEHARPWIYVLCAVTLVPAIRNNQLVLPSTLLVIYGLRANYTLLRGALLSTAIVLKTLPIALIGLLLLRGDSRTAATTTLTLAVASASLAAFALGPELAWQAHLDWPAQVNAHEPTQALNGVFVSSLNDNQSLAAMLVRMAPPWLAPIVPSVRYALLTGLTIATAAATWKHRRDPSIAATLPVWLAYIVLAAPFGRYYYLPLLLPALIHELSEPRSQLRRNWLCAISILLAAAARNDFALAILSAGTFALTLRRLALKPAMAAAPATDLAAAKGILRNS